MKHKSIERRKKLLKWTLKNALNETSEQNLQIFLFIRFALQFNNVVVLNERDAVVLNERNVFLVCILKKKKIADDIKCNIK